MSNAENDRAIRALLNAEPFTPQSVFRSPRGSGGGSTRSLHGSPSFKSRSPLTRSASRHTNGGSPSQAASRGRSGLAPSSPTGAFKPSPRHSDRPDSAAEGVGAGPPRVDTAPAVPSKLRFASVDLDKGHRSPHPLRKPPAATTEVTTPRGSHKNQNRIPWGAGMGIQPHVYPSTSPMHGNPMPPSPFHGTSPMHQTSLVSSPKRGTAQHLTPIKKKKKGKRKTRRRSRRRKSSKSPALKSRSPGKRRHSTSHQSRKLTPVGLSQARQRSQRRRRSVKPTAPTTTFIQALHPAPQLKDSGVGFVTSEPPPPPRSLSAGAVGTGGLGDEFGYRDVRDASTAELPDDASDRFTDDALDLYGDSRGSPGPGNYSWLQHLASLEEADMRAAGASRGGSPVDSGSDRFDDQPQELVERGQAGGGGSNAVRAIQRDRLSRSAGAMPTRQYTGTGQAVDVDANQARRQTAASRLMKSASQPHHVVQSPFATEEVVDAYLQSRSIADMPPQMRRFLQQATTGDLTTAADDPSSFDELPLSRYVARYQRARQRDGSPGEKPNGGSKRRGRAVAPRHEGMVMVRGFESSLLQALKDYSVGPRPGGRPAPQPHQPGYVSPPGEPWTDVGARGVYGSRSGPASPQRRSPRARAAHAEHSPLVHDMGQYADVSGASSGVCVVPTLLAARCA